jgi:hypothetical protein
MIDQRFDTCHLLRRLLLFKLLISMSYLIIFVIFVIIGEFLEIELIHAYLQTLVLFYKKIVIGLTK